MPTKFWLVEDAGWEPKLRRFDIFDLQIRTRGGDARHSKNNHLSSRVRSKPRYCLPTQHPHHPCFPPLPTTSVGARSAQGGHRHAKRQTNKPRGKNKFKQRRLPKSPNDGFGISFFFDQGPKVHSSLLHFGFTKFTLTLRTDHSDSRMSPLCSAFLSRPVMIKKKK